MTSDERREVLGILGGTGPQGRGLACRWAGAGHTVWIGSRSRERAAEAVDDVAGRVTADVDLRSGTNAEAAEAAEIVVVAVPYDAQTTLLPPLREAVGDKVVCNVVNPMEFDELGPRAVPVEDGSAAEECQRLWPEARVVSGFHDVSSRRLLRPGERIDAHVLLCADDADAAHRVAHLAARVEGMWGVYCGPLRNSQHIENITPVILSVNQYYQVQAGLLIDGLTRDLDSVHRDWPVDTTTAGREPR